MLTSRLTDKYQKDDLVQKKAERFVAFECGNEANNGLGSKVKHQRSDEKKADPCENGQRSSSF
jgi:hypothetical protein